MVEEIINNTNAGKSQGNCAGVTAYMYNQRNKTNTKRIMLFLYVVLII